MKAAFRFHKFTVAALPGLLIGLMIASGPVWADEISDKAELDRLFAELKDADAASSSRIDSEINRLWSRSGSPAMDLLLERGAKSVEQGDFETALDHLTALTDYAPDFAAGWNERAIAYFQMGRFGLAVSDLQRTLTLNPRNYGALTGFAVILEQMERPAQALEVYRAALAIHPHLREVLDAVKRLEVQTAGQEI